MFKGRAKELNKLSKLWEKDKFEMVIVYGRRRVGKTTLINEFCKGKRTVFFAAMESSAENNLVSFSKSVFEAEGKMSKATFDSYEALLMELREMTKEERTVVVIDEYPYLANSEKSFSSLLQNMIDIYFKETKMYLILCGSSMNFMENQVLGYESPLYGRRTAQFKIEPFDYMETASWFQMYNSEERALAYGVSGGIPLYVELLDGYESMKEAMLSEVFDKSAYLFEEPENLLKQELREAQNYNAIITAIAAGSSRMNQIATKTNLDTALCSKYMKKLIELGILRKESPIGEGSNVKPVYQLYDQMFRFWYRFVPSNMSAIVSERITDTFDVAVGAYLSDYMGLTFEEMAKQFILYYDKDLPIDMGEIGQWWGTHSEDRKQVQIDVVVLSPDKKVAVFGECKYKNTLVDIDVLEHLIHVGKAFPKHLTHTYYYLFAKIGFTNRLKKRAKAENIRLVTLEEMLQK